MISLKLLFSQLKSSSKTKNSIKTDYYDAVSIPGFRKHKLAKDKNNNPCLLLNIDNSKVDNLHPPLRLENLTILYNVECKTICKNAEERNRYTVICCTGRDQLIKDYFFKICNTIVSIIGIDPTPELIYDAVDKLVELFRSLSNSPKKSIQGLWAELFLISISKDPKELIEAWHQSPLEKYDFSKNDQRIEVKSSTSNKREHHFSLEQINPEQGTKVLVASIFVERIGTGISLMEVADIIRSRINFDPELVFHIDQVISLTLGRKWKLAENDKFDYELAKKSLSFFRSELIPTINPDIPNSISNVHFKVDLSNIKPINKQEFRLYNEIFKAAYPFRK
jgi:hypothetical protein